MYILIYIINLSIYNSNFNQIICYVKTHFFIENKTSTFESENKYSKGSDNYFYEC